MGGYIIQPDTTIWTSLSRTLWDAGRLTQSILSLRGSSLLCLPLPLRRQLLLHRRLHLHHQLDLKRHPHLQLHRELNLQLHPELEAKREAATATSGRANRDKSATTSP